MSSCTITYTSSLDERAQFRARQFGCFDACRKAECWCSYDIKIEHRGAHSFWEAIQQSRYGEQLEFVKLTDVELGIYNKKNQCLGCLDYIHSQDWNSAIKNGATYKLYFIGVQRGRIITMLFLEAFRFTSSSRIKMGCKLASYNPYEKVFPLKIVGVTYNNPDGSNRQEIIARCKAGEQLDLVREPNNPKHDCAIAVYRKTGEQIGYIPFDVAEFELSGRLDYPHPEEQVSAKIIEIKGGPSFETALHYGCVIQISVKHKRPNPQDLQASFAISDARLLESLEPENSILFYKQGIRSLGYKVEPSTIMRLTKLLEELGRYRECHEEIASYEKMGYRSNISITDSKALSTLERRKERIAKTLRLER